MSVMQARPMPASDRMPAPLPLAARAETPDAGADAPSLQYLCFTIAGDPCAMRIDDVREILEVGRLTPLPLVPAFVSGVMNLRGSVVPVIDLGARLGLAPITLGRRSCIVVADVPAADAGEGAPPQTLGLLVEAVHEVFDCRPADREPVPRLGTRVAARFLRHMVRTRGRATPEIDLQAALDVPVLAALVAAHRRPG